MADNILPTNQSTRSIWFEDAVISKYPRFSGDLMVDVCIIGAGITGLTAADILKKAGKTVAVIDAGRVGCGETGHTSAHLTEVLDLDFRDLISKFGKDGAELAAQSSRRAIEKIEDNIIGKQIQCGFRRVTGWQYTEKEEQIADLENEAEAASKIGVSNQVVNELPYSKKVARAIRFDHQAQFQPIAYLSALAKSVDGDGCYIFEETRMLDITDGEPCQVKTENGIITAADVVMATNVPSANRLLLQTKIASYRTYVIAAPILSGPEAGHLFWDIDDPYHYVRSVEMNGRTYLLIGGEDHKTGQDEHTSAHYENLERWARERFDIGEVTYRWSGQVVEPVDGLPFIGKNAMSDNIFVATGFSGNGLTFGTVAGLLISDLILNIENPWADLYDPTRIKPFASLKQFVAENIDYPSHFVADRISTPKEHSLNEIRENQGAIVNIGGKKVAAYRDPEGELTVLSPACPHMGCHVHWNEAEVSWDCPCHGARFGPKGNMINGPAVQDLAKEEYDENAPMIPERYDNPLRPDDPFSPPLVTFCKLT